MVWLSAWLLLGGCGKLEEHERARRVWEMEDHARSVSDARSAITRGELAAARAAGDDLAMRDPLPGVSPGARAFLASLREDGDRLSKAQDLDSAATLLAGMTRHCAGCHASMHVPFGEPFREGNDDLLWFGLIFESDVHWERGLAKHERADTLRVARGWPARRAAMSTSLRP
jgi:hypothetical protein